MRFHNITHDDMRNGEGLRVVLWVAGCDHRCPECHNPITWDKDGGAEFTFRDAEEIFRELEKEHVAGVTFSGGDPFHPDNRYLLSVLIGIIRFQYPDKTIWVYTGYTWEEILKIPKLAKMLNSIDVLVDGRFVAALKSDSYPWAGSTNQRVIDVHKSLKEGRIVLHVHH